MFRSRVASFGAEKRAAAAAVSSYEHPIILSSCRLTPRTLSPNLTYYIISIFSQKKT